jgi:HPt (histidine-containing phosphotransfer) domain-containing protein
MEPNPDYIDKLAGGDQGFRSELINIIKTELPQECDTYFSALEREDREGLVAIVHKLKHKVSLLGMTEGYALTASYEEALRLGSWTGREEFEQLLKRMITFIGSL